MDERRLRGLPAVDRFGSIVWWRLLLPDLLEHVDRLLYLDCDTLVLSSLHPLWREDMGTCALAAVANVVEPQMRDHVATLGVDYPGGFFNAGVLLLQLDRMRDERSTNELLNYALSHQKALPWNDQDALNVIFNRRWHSLHPRWNAQNNLWSWRDWAIDVFGPQLVDEAVSAPAIRHFEGPSVAKPWHYLCPVPHRDAYLQMLAQTPWAGTPMQDRTPSTMAIRLLPRRWRLDVYGRLLTLKSRLGRIRSPAVSDRE
jgi:lipopolysaccharide biosynthesis glycosyltransferase